MPSDSPRAAADRRLLTRLRSGDDRAFEALHARYQPALVRYARGFVACGGTPPEDLVQEAFFSAYRALRADARDVDVRPYLYRCVRNRCLDERRRRAPALEQLLDARPGGHDPADVAERHEMVREVLGAVARLPRRQQRALVAITMEGDSYEGIARRLGTSASGAKSLVNRARSGVRHAHALAA